MYWRWPAASTICVDFVSLDCLDNFTGIGLQLLLVACLSFLFKSKVGDNLRGCSWLARVKDRYVRVHLFLYSSLVSKLLFLF